MGKLHKEGEVRLTDTDQPTQVPFIGHELAHRRKHTRKLLQFFWNNDPTRGRMKYGLGFHVIMAGLLQDERGVVLYPKNMFDPQIVEGNFAKATPPSGEGPYQVYWQSHDLHANFDSDGPGYEDFHAAYHDAGSAAVNIGWGPLVPIDIPHALKDSFSYAAPLNSIVDESKAHTYVCQWDAGDSDRLVTSFETNWKNTNAGNWFDIGGNHITISNKIKYILACTEFHGALSGCAHLAMACGKPVHIYLPGADTSGLSDYYKTSLLILRKAGAIIHYNSI